MLICSPTHAKPVLSLDDLLSYTAYFFLGPPSDCLLFLSKILLKSVTLDQRFRHSCSVLVILSHFIGLDMKNEKKNSIQDVIFSCFYFIFIEALERAEQEIVTSALGFSLLISLRL